MRTFTITDIHGCNKTFNSLLDSIGLNQDDELLLLGDYIDRGPDSKGVFDTILRLLDQNFKVTCLMGNHEEVLLRALVDPHSSKAKNWVQYYGGDKTLASFGAKAACEIDSVYLNLIRSFSYFHEKENHIFVHAGLNLQITEPFSDKNAMLWTKKNNQFINPNWIEKRIVVHGHTPQNQKEIESDLKNTHKRPFIGIDNGCVYPVAELGNLCAIELNSQQLFFEPNIDC